MPAVLRDDRDKALYVAIGQRVQLIRKGLGLTQTELAEEVGVSHQRIAYIERGQPAVQMHMLYRIAEALGCKLSDLLPEEEDYARYRKEVRRAGRHQKGAEKGSAAHVRR